MPDFFDDDENPAKRQDDPLKPLNLKERAIRPAAVAIRDRRADNKLPEITAAGRGMLAEQILQLAFENGIRVREDSALAEMLVKFELDSPIPSEAFMALAEILSYVYQADNAPEPFNAILDDFLNLEEGRPDRQ